MPLTNEGKARALMATLNGPLYLALHTAKGEVDNAAYLRQPIEFGEAATRGKQTVRSNTNRIGFPSYAADVTEEVRFWTIYDDPLTGSALVSDELETIRAPLRGEAPFFRPGDIEVALE